MKKIILGIGVVLLVVAGFLFFGQKPVSSPASQQPVLESMQAANSISIKNFSFTPAALTVKVGDTVTWTNQDAATHTIKSENFNSSPLPNGGTFSFAFMTKGTFIYNCGIHPSMKGSIIVE